MHSGTSVEASFIPFADLLKSWSKHRPKEAGAVEGNRPDFGTVFISVPCFEGGAEHAARYVTKYLIKAPDDFPDWVLDMGKDRRIRRFDTSKGFWGNPPKHYIKNPDSKVIPRQKRSYRERLGLCGKGVNIIEIASFTNSETGEITQARQWVGKLDADAREVMEKLFDPGNPNRTRKSLLANSPGHAKQIIEAAAGKELQWLGYRNTGNKDKFYSNFGGLIHEQKPEQRKP